MVVIFIYDASGCTVFNQENVVKPNFFKQELGRCVVDLDPLHLSRELRWVDYKLRRLGCTKPNIRNRVCEQLAHGLRAKEHVYIEI